MKMSSVQASEVLGRLPGNSDVVSCEVLASCFDSANGFGIRFHITRAL
jgi:hypothetical protein